MKNYSLQVSCFEKNKMSYSFLRYFIYFFIGCISSIFTQVHADVSVVSPTSVLPGDPPADITATNVPYTGSAGDFIGNIIAQFIGVVAVLTILAVTWAGIQMVLAIGEEEKMKKARHTMIYAFIGLGVSWLSYGIVSFITSLKLDSF